MILTMVCFLDVTTLVVTRGIVLVVVGISMKNWNGNRTTIWTGGFGFLELALFLQAFDSVHTLMVWCGPERFVYKDGLVCNVL